MSEVFRELLALGVAGVSALGAYYAFLAKRHASEVSDAVNHRHQTGTPRLYDLALENHAKVDELVEWKRGYDGGPLDSGDKVDEFTTDVLCRLDNLERACDDCPLHDVCGNPQQDSGNPKPGGSRGDG